MSDVVFKILQQEYSVIPKVLEPQIEPLKTNQLIEKSNQRSALTLSELRLKERIERTRENYAQGWTQKEIARVLGINPKTISHYLQVSSAEIHCRRSRRNLDPFKSYLCFCWSVLIGG